MKSSKAIQKTKDAKKARRARRQDGVGEKSTVRKPSTGVEVAARAMKSNTLGPGQGVAPPAKSYTRRMK